MKASRLFLLTTVGASIAFALACGPPERIEKDDTAEEADTDTGSDTDTDTDSGIEVVMEWTDWCFSGFGLYMSGELEANIAYKEGEPVTLEMKQGDEVLSGKWEDQQLTSASFVYSEEMARPGTAFAGYLHTESEFSVCIGCVETIPLEGNAVHETLGEETLGLCGELTIELNGE